MKPLHRLQIALMKVLRGIPDDEGYSLEQLRIAIGASSKSQIVHHLQQLEQRGMIKRDPDNSAHFIVFGDDETEDAFTFLPLLALASAGRGNENEQHVIEQIPVRSTFIPTHIKDSFLVRAEGDSMEPRIKDKDVVLVERYIAGRHNPNGKVVICEEGHECKIKKYMESNGSIVLVSYNDKKYPAHVVKNRDSLHIHGIVRGVLFTSIE